MRSVKAGQDVWMVTKTGALVPVRVQHRVDKDTAVVERCDADGGSLSLAVEVDLDFLCVYTDTSDSEYLTPGNRQDR